MIRSVTAVGALLTAVMAVAGCASGDGVGIGHHQPGTARAHTDATSLGQPDEPIAGPQGATPQFLVECLYSHAAADDPIVYPGQPGHSHLHMFFGNTEVDALTTVESLRNGDTTCDQPLDKAAYWAPALLRGAEVLTPVKSTAYYRPGQGVEPSTVQPFPEGLVMIGGNSGATGEQPLSVVAWGCGAGIERAVRPPSVREGATCACSSRFPIAGMARTSTATTTTLTSPTAHEVRAHQASRLRSRSCSSAWSIRCGAAPTACCWRAVRSPRAMPTS